MTQPKEDWYQTPIYYDIVFSGLSHDEAEFLDAVYDAELSRKRFRRRLFEPACGSGRLLLAMAERGYKVGGIDLEPAMVRFAKQRLKDVGKAAQIRQGDMSRFMWHGKCDMAFCLVSSFKYVLSEEGARAHLTRIAEILERGGLYVLGFHLSDYDQQGEQHERHEGERGDIEVVCNIRSWPPNRKRRRERLRSRLHIVHSGKKRRLESLWDFRSYNEPQFLRLLKSVPELEMIDCYDMNYDLSAPQKFGENTLDQVVLLRKK